MEAIVFLDCVPGNALDFSEDQNLEFRKKQKQKKSKLAFLRKHGTKEQNKLYEIPNMHLMLFCL